MGATTAPRIEMPGDLVGAPAATGPVKQVAFSAPPEPVPTPVPSSQRSLISLDDAIGSALMQNPDLVALRQNEGVGQAVVGVAQTYPLNPFVQTQYFPPGQGLAGNSQMSYYVWVMQTLELAHQRRHREASASAGLNSIRWNIRQAELLNLAQTERLYFSAMYLRDLRDLAVAAADLNDQMLGVVQRRFDAGQASGASRTLTRVTSRQTRRQADLAEANYQTALLGLRQQMRVSPTCPVEPLGDLPRWRWLPVLAESTAGPGACPTEVIAADLVNGRPDLMAARADAATARANADLARANRIPNFAIGPIINRDDFGNTFSGFRTQSTIPVFDTGRPLLAQRQAELRQRHVAAEQLHARASLEAQAAIDRYERARRMVERSSPDFRMPIQYELRQTDAQFQAGQIDILGVFATRASLIQDRRAYLDLVNELAQSAANVTAATGLPPARLVAAAP